MREGTCIVSSHHISHVRVLALCEVDGNRPDIRDLACQLSASLFWWFVVSDRSVPSLVIILEFYSDAPRRDIELSQILWYNPHKNFVRPHIILCDRIKFLCGFQFVAKPLRTVVLDAFSRQYDITFARAAQRTRYSRCKINFR